MALVATPGASNANGFLTVAEADSLAAEHPFGAPWIAISVSQIKEAYIITATRILNSQCFLGQATTSTQYLGFPRSGLLNRNGYSLDPTIVPLEVKQATFELILVLIDSSTVAESPIDVLGITEVKAGPVSLKFKDDISFKIVPDSVRDVLVPSWLCPVIEDPWVHTTKRISFRVSE